jgi:hypothetical protein
MQAQFLSVDSRLSLLAIIQLARITYCQQVDVHVTAVVSPFKLSFVAFTSLNIAKPHSATLHRQ